jgi:outer membrane protein TolC
VHKIVLLAALGALAGAAVPRAPATQPPRPAVLLAPQDTPPPGQLPETAPPPRPLTAPAAPQAALPPGDIAELLKSAQPISLPVALRLAETANLDIAQAQQVIARARAALQRAFVMGLPNINLGSSYVRHEGMFQKTEGNIIKVNRDSLFVGGGPSMSFALNEALFAPLVGRQVFVSTQAGLRRVTNDTLLEVADVYLNVLRARRRLARVEATLDFLVSQQPSAARAGSRGLLPVVTAIQEAGGAVALKSEVERVRVEVMRRQEERVMAVQDFVVSSAELARLLRLDPAIPLWPIEDFRIPLPLATEAYAARPLEDLVGVALNNRPELAENKALVAASVQRVRTAQYRPLLPNLVLNYNWGDFGGGPDLNGTVIQNGKVVTLPGFGPSGQIHHFAPRSDFDVTLLWRLNNLGFGNVAEIRENQAAARQASLRLLQVRDLVITQVVRNLEAVQGWKQRMGVAKASLFDDAGRPDGPVFRSLRLNFQRIREVPETRPLEVLDSIRGLNDLLDLYAQTVTDYERAQFRLLRALGFPAYALVDPAAFAGPRVGLDHAP